MHFGVQHVCVAGLFGAPVRGLVAHQPTLPAQQAQIRNRRRARFTVAMWTRARAASVAWDGSRRPSAPRRRIRCWATPRAATDSLPGLRCCRARKRKRARWLRSRGRRGPVPEERIAVHLRRMSIAVSPAEDPRAIRAGPLRFVGWGFRREPKWSACSSRSAGRTLNLGDSCGCQTQRTRLDHGTTPATPSSARLAAHAR